MTAPITPDERAAMRERYAADLPSARETSAAAHARALRDLGAHARVDVPRLLDALDTAEAEIEAAQRQHNAAFESVRASARERARAAESWEARTHEALDQRDKALADVALLRPALVQWEEGFEEETDRLDAIVERQRDRLRAREEQVRRLRAEVTRLHALVADLRAAFARVPHIEGTYLVDEVDGCTCGGGPGSGTGMHEAGCGTEPRIDLRALDGWDTLVEAARPAPVWDEGTVTEAVALAMFPHYFTDDRQPLRVFTETRSDAELRDAERESARHRARQALAVVREHLPVKPDQETIARAVLDALDGCVDYETQYLLADAVLALWPGESRAAVQAEAVRRAVEAVEVYDDVIPDGLGFRVRGVAADDLLGYADRLDPRGADRG